MIHRPETFGAIGDGTTDDLPAFTAMIAKSEDNDAIQLGPNVYLLKGTLHVNKTLIWCGEPSPHYSLPLSMLATPADVLGVRVLRRSTFQDIGIKSAGGSAGSTGSQFHGIWCRATVCLRNIRVEDFAGHGVMIDTSEISVTTTAVSVLNGIATAQVTNPNHGIVVDMIVATTGHSVNTARRGVPVLAVDSATGAISYALAAPDGPLGAGVGWIKTVENANHWEAQTVRCVNNWGDGFHTLGPDSNAGIATALDCTNNLGEGVHEASFLGNTYLACHTSGNDAGSYVKPPTADNNRSLFLNCYSEGNQPGPAITYPALAWGGLGNWPGGDAVPVFNVSFNRSIDFLNSTNPENPVEFNVGGAANTVFGYLAYANGAHGRNRLYRKQFLTLGSFAHWFVTRYNNSNRAVVEAESGDAATLNERELGAGQKWFPNGLYFGSTTAPWKLNTATRGQQQVIEWHDASVDGYAIHAEGYALVPPGDGQWNMGDRIWNSQPQPGAPMGWIYTAQGWRAMPNLA